ncbi:MAG: hypothetical protein ACM34I_01190 [bacterium]
MGGIKVVISVSGGNVNGVFTDTPGAKVYLVDYDNLEASSSEDCSQRFPAGNLDEFRSSVTEDIQFFPGIAKLLARLNG